MGGRIAFDAADPPSSNKLAIEMLTRHVLITDVSVLVMLVDIASYKVPEILLLALYW